MDRAANVAQRARNKERRPSSKRGRKPGTPKRTEFRITFANGVTYEISNARHARNARSIARDIEAMRGQSNGAIVRVEKRAGWEPVRG